MHPHFDIMAFVNQVLCTYDEIAKREDLAVNDLIEGLIELSPRFSKFAQSIESLKESIHKQFMRSNAFFNERNWWYLHSISFEFFSKACRESVSEEEFNELLVEYFRDHDCEQLKSVVNKWSKFGLERRNGVRVEKLNYVSI